MRGRRRKSSAAAHYNSSVTQQQVRMTPRKQMIKDANAAPPGNQQGKEETQEDEMGDDSENEEEFPSSPPSPTSSREKRRRQREKKSKVKEMTEEEMMDLALRLSEQEASAAALRLQQEQDAVMKAIQESMTQTQSQSLLTNVDTSSSLPPRRKLLYPNKQAASAGHQEASKAGAASEADLSQDLKGGGDQNNNRRKKRKWKDGSPLPEMPDLSQTQNVYSQASPFSSQSSSVPLDLQQDSDLTQIDQCQLQKSPVLPSLPPAAYKPEVHVTKLSQELLASCETSGFVLCSQESLTSTRKPLPSQPKSPTFPKSPACSESLALSKSATFLKSPVSSETDQGEDGETERSPGYFKSPVFGRTNENQDSLLPCKPEVEVCKLNQELQVTCKTSGFILCSQESLTTSEKPLSLQPKSPVFPRSPGVSKNLARPNSTSFPKSPVQSETDQGDDGATQQSHGSSISPVFGRTSPVFGRTPDARNPPQCLTEGNGIDRDHGDEFGQIIVPSKSGREEKPNEISKDWSSATELTSDITLCWSDEDEDITQVVDSPSPIFPEEKPPHSQNASPNHAAAASPGTSGASCSLNQQRSSAAEEAERLAAQRRDKPSSSAASSSQQQRAETSPAEQPVSAAAAPSAGPGGEPTVHYYWGVPFCPRGLDPDTYTRVIVAQMEVYEKSLKQAQRRLLRKAEWSEAILPQPEKSPSPSSPAESPQLHIPQRRGLRLRDRRPGEEPSAPAAEREEEEEGRKEDGEVEEGERRKKEEEAGGGEADMSDCEVCPETQLSDNDDTQELIVSTNNGAQPQPASPTLPEIWSLLRQRPPDQEQQQEEEEMEVDNPADRETESSIPASNTNGGEDVRMEEEEERRGPEADQVQDGALQMSVSPGPEAAAASQSGELRVDCPICQGSFPAAEIEVHAAYCDGEVEVVEELRPEADCYPASLRPRRKRGRRGEAAAEETADPSGLGRTAQTRQKCFVCQKVVPLKDYSRHTHHCMQRPAANTAPRGNLLSALERTESRDSEAGPSGSNFSSRAGDVIDLRFQEEEEEESESAPAFRISSSPIRSFTPISEATDCLVDFKKQHRAKKPSQRRR